MINDRMDVAKLLVEWNLASFVERFQKAGIDEEVFENINDEMLSKLFDPSECGYQHKFSLRYKAWKSGHTLPDITRTENIPQSHQLCTLSTPEISSNIPLEIINLSTATVVPRMNVRQLMACKYRGLLACAIQKQIISLHPSWTSLVSDTVIEHELESTHVAARIKASRYVELANEIGEIFGTDAESIENIARAFYFPFQRATKSENHVNAGGILLDKWNYLRSKSIKYELVEKKELLNHDIGISSIEGDVLWLTKNNFPEAEVNLKWKNTFANRPKCDNVEYYFSLFKCLQAPYGHKLLSYDFDRVYPEAALKIQSWEEIAPAILDVARARKKLSSNDEALITDGKIDVVAFLILPKLLGTLIHKRKSIEADVFGTNLKDLTDSFIFQAKTEDELDEFKRLRLRKFQESHTFIGPYVACIGDLKDDHNCTLQIFVVINNLNFKIETNRLVDAIDYCYKSFFSLNVDFSAECKHIWIFLQKYLYKNRITKNFKQYQRVTKLKDDIDAILNLPHSNTDSLSLSNNTDES